MGKEPQMSKKTNPSDDFPLDQADYWKKKKKIAIQTRDQAKQRLNEAKQKLAELEAQGSLSEYLTKFIKNIELTDLNEFNHQWLMHRICEVEITDHTIVRMEGNAAIIQLLRNMGTSLFTPASNFDRINSGLMGQLVELNLDVYLNNSLNKKIRFFIKPITLKPFEFPCEPFKQDFKDQISYAVDGIRGTLGSLYPMAETIVTGELKKVATRVTVRNVHEFAEKMEEISLSLLKELKANNAICIAYPEVFVASDPKRLQHDVSISVSFSSDAKAHADFTVEDDKP